MQKDDDAHVKIPIRDYKIEDRILYIHDKAYREKFTGSLTFHYSQGTAGKVEKKEIIN